MFRRDGIVFPAGRIDVDGFTEGYARFQAASRRLRGRETYLKPHLVSAWLDEVVRRPAMEVIPGSHRRGQVGVLRVAGDVHASYAKGVRSTGAPGIRGRRTNSASACRSRNSPPDSHGFARRRHP
jgi:hypothetical protein